MFNFGQSCKMTFLKCIFATVCISECVGAVPRVDPLVDSKAGLIRGYAATDGDYNMFLGIPYARLNETNPFSATVPFPKFEDVFNASDDSALCPQIELLHDTIVGSLDCLRLNVYVPTTASSENRLPVLVWIYGGAFRSGNAGRYLYGPKFLVRHGIVLVSINYRLGPYGFMCLDTPAVPGNQGLKDQLIALRWIKDNIETFGGDANKITLFGQSAGGVSIDFQIHLMQENLFHQGILQSGTALNPWVIQNPGNEGPLKLAEHLGVVTSDVNEALSFLATVDTKLVIAAVRDLDLTFNPCVERTFDDVAPVLTDYPLNLPIRNARKIPIIIGFNNDEGLSFLGKADAKALEDIDIIGKSIKESFDLQNHSFNEMSEIVRHFYFGDKRIGEETRRQILNVFSDFNFTHPVQRSLRKYFDNGANTIFSYMFSYNGERNLVKYNHNISFGGAAHGDEQSYLFDVFYMKDIMPDKDQVIVDRMTTLWTNFAKYGNPTPETTDLLPVNWIPTTNEAWNYLNIDSELTIESRPFHERMAFLDLLYKANEKFQIGFKEKSST